MRWPIGQVDELIRITLENDAAIKTKMGIGSESKARVYGYRVPPVTLPGLFPYIFFYCIPGPNAPGQGTSIIQHNPDYDIEVRTQGAPTANSDSIVDRIDELIGKMKAQLTPDHNWVVSARSRAPISIPEQGEAPEIYYTRRGNTYKFAVVPA